MKTITIGEMLQTERQRHRLSLSELSGRTRIKLEYLLALEANQFDQLPAATFIKGYIKSYGQILGFDAQPLLALLRRDFKESARGQLVPREFLKPVLKPYSLWTPITLVIIGTLVVFLTLLSYVGWQWYSLNQPPPLEVSSPVDSALVAPQVVVTGRTSPEATLLVNAQPVALRSDGSFSTSVFILREGIVTITVEAKDRRGKSHLIQRTVNVQF